VLAGVITVEEACRRYQLSEEEFLSWQRAFEALASEVYAPHAFSVTATCVCCGPSGRVSNPPLASPEANFTIPAATATK